MQRSRLVGSAHGYRAGQACGNLQCSRIAREAHLTMTGATEVHHALSAPEWKRVGQYEIAARVVPARHISGDYVCSIEHEVGTFIVLVDLMGKGLSAAMWITHIADLVHRSAENSQNVGDLLERFNMEIVRSRISAPLTSAVAISIGKEDGAVGCALAGHPPVVVFRRNGRSETITAGGPLLGVSPNARYERQRVCLERSESILAFSDGLSEVLTHDVSLLGEVIEATARHANSAPDKVSALLRASTDLANGAPHDDISIVAVQRL